MPADPRYFSARAIISSLKRSTLACPPERFRNEIALNRKTAFRAGEGGKVRILIVGSGGREHALAWKLAQSPLVEEIQVAPGNGGTAGWRNVPIAAGDVEGLIRHARKEGLDFVLPGGEESLALGITDACREAGLACFGPDRYAAGLESSKLFAKEIMEEAGVPTAGYSVFRDYAGAAAALERCSLPVAIKADGLAAGKGVVVAGSKEEALRALDDFLRKRTLGRAGETLLLEEGLQGEEVSLLAFCDGEKALPLPSARDHKRAFDGDAGPNTGGMGAYSPAPALPDEKAGELCALVMDPVLRLLRARGHPFKGVLYAGLMFTAEGPRVLEYNARFGDPECQPLLLRLESDLAEIMQACLEGRLELSSLRFNPHPAVCVVLAAEGYPGEYLRDLPISGLPEPEKGDRVLAFHAGTRLAGDRLLSSGGRVLGVSCLGPSLERARLEVYAALEKIRMPHSFFRRDIAAGGREP
jgi:phosphoribosylamine--glycine ligase